MAKAKTEVNVKDHKITKKDLKENPELLEQGLKVGDKVGVVNPEIIDKEELEKIETNTLEEEKITDEAKPKEEIKNDAPLPKKAPKVLKYRGKTIIGIKKVIINGIERNEVDLNDEKVLLDDEELSKIK